MYPEPCVIHVSWLAPAFIAIEQLVSLSCSKDMQLTARQNGGRRMNVMLSNLSHDLDVSLAYSIAQISHQHVNF
jgi:hypothetical protein